MWRRGRGDLAAWSAAGRRGLEAVAGASEASRRPPSPVLSPRRRPILARGAQAAPHASAPASAGFSAARAWSFAAAYCRAGGGARRPADRRSPNSLCPHPRAGRGPPRHLAPSLSPPTPVCPQEGAGVRPLFLPNKRFGARRAPGRWEAAPSSRLPPFPRNLTGILFATRGQFKVGSRTQNLNRIAKMKS